MVGRRQRHLRGDRGISGRAVVAAAGVEAPAPRPQVDPGLDHPAAASRDRTPSPVSRPAVTDTEPAYEYLLDIMLGGGLNLLREAMTSLINRYAAEGWSFYTISSDFKGAGGCWIVFRRRRESGKRGEDGE